MTHLMPIHIDRRLNMWTLQEQRDIIREQLSDIETQLDFCPPQKIRNQLMNRKTVLLGKLSTCEQRIAKMCA